MLPIRKNTAAIDQRFIEYVLALTDGVTGRIIDLLRRAAIDALGHKSKSVGIDQLLMAGAHLPRPNLVGSPNVLNKMTDKRAHIQIEKFERVAAIALEDDWITLLVDTPTKTVPVEYTIADMVEFQ